MRITVWNEFRQEKTDEPVQAVYPEGIHNAIANYLSDMSEFEVRTATLDEPKNGLPQAVIDDTDVLVWWGHRAQQEVADDVTDRVQTAVLGGMGFIALHSANYSKPFRRLMGTGCGLCWREDDKLERLWVVDPTHPIAAGIDRYIEIPRTEMYGEFFDVPSPDETVFISWFEGGEVMRSGLIWKRGKGKVFYFRPGHETLPIYHQPEVMHVIENACKYVCAGDTTKVTGISETPNAAESPEEKRRA